VHIKIQIIMSYDNFYQYIEIFKELQKKINFRVLFLYYKFLYYVTDTKYKTF